jgi:hypothetical protein
MHRQIGPARKVLPEQAIGVLIRAALPGTLRVAEINVDFGRQRKATVIFKFVSPSHVIPVPLSPTGCSQSCEPGLHFQDPQKRLRQIEYEPSMQDGRDNKLPSWTARVTLNAYKSGRRGARHHAFDEHISSKPAHASRR